MSDFSEFALQNWLLFVAFFAILGLLAGNEILRKIRGVTALNAAESLRLINDQEAWIVDIRDGAEYRESHPLENDQLEAHLPRTAVAAMVDRRQLQQVVTVLVHNALVYGRLPGEPARIGVHAHLDAGGAPVLDVTDRGPGIPETVAAQLFRPFFTTSGHGTGLGLYIARELCQANQASLDYVAVPAGGACFRIRLAGARAIATT